MWSGVVQCLILCTYKNQRLQFSKIIVIYLLLWSPAEDADGYYFAVLRFQDIDLAFESGKTEQVAMQKYTF